MQIKLCVCFDLCVEKLSVNYWSVTCGIIQCESEDMTRVDTPNSMFTAKREHDLHNLEVSFFLLPK